MSLCECGVEVKNTKHPGHIKGEKHQAYLNGNGANPEVALDADLQAIADAVHSTPQERGKLTRRAFKKRGWPNDEHPGTVRDFMEAHDIPCIYLPSQAPYTPPEDKKE